MSGANKPNSDAKPDQQEKRKKESILELTKFLEKSIRVKFAGGREASGVLKGIFTWIKLKWYTYVTVFSIVLGIYLKSMLASNKTQKKFHPARSLDIPVSKFNRIFVFLRFWSSFEHCLGQHNRVFTRSRWPLQINRRYEATWFGGMPWP